MKTRKCDSCEKEIGGLAGITTGSGARLRVQRFRWFGYFDFSWDEIDLCGPCFMGLKQIWTRLKP